MFVNRNVAAQAVVLLLPPAAVLLLVSGRERWRWPALLAVASGLTFLLATWARGAWLGLAGGLVLGAIVLVAARRGDNATRPAWRWLAAARPWPVLTACSGVPSSPGWCSPSPISSFSTRPMPVSIRRLPISSPIWWPAPGAAAVPPSPNQNDKQNQSRYLLGRRCLQTDVRAG